MARLLGPSGYGTLVIPMSLAYMFLALDRAAIGSPLIVLMSRARLSPARPALAAQAVGVAIAIGMVGALAAVVGGAAVSEWRTALLWMAVWLLPIVVQDVLRYASFALDRGRTAVLSDGLWLVTECFGFGLLHQLQHTDPAAMLGCWGMGAVIGALFASWKMRIVPRTQVREWHSKVRGLAGWLSLQAVLAQAVGQASVVGLVALLGAREVGALRAMQTLFAPATSLAVVVNAVLIPPFTADLGRSAELAKMRIWRTALWLAGGASLAIGALFLERGELVHLVYGHRYAAYAGLLTPFALTAALQCIAAAPAAGLQALQAGRSLFVTQGAAIAVGLPAMLFLARAAGTGAVAWTIFGQSALMLFLATRFFNRQVRLGIPSDARTDGSDTVESDILGSQVVPEPSLAEL